MSNPDHRPKSQVVYPAGFFNDPDDPPSRSSSTPTSVPMELLSIRDADTGESEMHIRRVPEGFSLQVQQRGEQDYLSVILIPDTARELRDYLASNLPTPETQAELNTLIDGLLATNTLRHPLHPELTAARSALLALYNRQREEAKYLRKEWNLALDCVSDLSSQLERLKAEQLEPEEAECLFNAIVKHPEYPLPIGTLSKLDLARRLSQQGDTENDRSTT